MIIEGIGCRSRIKITTFMVRVAGTAFLDVGKIRVGSRLGSNLLQDSGMAADAEVRLGSYQGGMAAFALGFEFLMGGKPFLGATRQALVCQVSRTKHLGSVFPERKPKPNEHDKRSPDP